MRLIPQPNSQDISGGLRLLGAAESTSPIEYEDTVEIAATIFGTPMALVALLEKDRQWIAARPGVRLVSSEPGSVFNEYVVASGKPLVVEDAAEDERFSDHSSVMGSLHIRFFAGVPLFNGKEIIGTLCAIDTIPRVVDHRKFNALMALGRQLSDLLQQRSTTAEMALRERHQNENVEEAKKTSTLHSLAARRFETLFHGLPIACFTFDERGVIREWNKASENSFGILAGQVVDESIFEFIGGPKRSTIAIKIVNKVLNGQTVENVEWAFRRPDKSVRRFNSSIFPLRGSGGQIVGGVGATSDITDRRLQERQLRSANSQLEAANVHLESLASRDGLTGIANYRAFSEQLESAFSLAIRHDEPLSLLLLDVDRFKALNDSHGHPAGDEVLRQLGGVLVAASRVGDFVARYGGEEFAILLPRTGAPKARQVAERIRRAVTDKSWQYSQITVSIGCASLDVDMPSPHDLVQRADRALYQSKHDGRDRVTMFDQVA